MGEPKKPKIGEPELRAMLARKARDLARVMITKHCRQMFLQQAQNHWWWYNQTEALAALKRKRDPRYLELSKSFLVRLAGSDIGHLAELPPDALQSLEKLFDGLIAFMSGKKVQPDFNFTGPEFARLTKHLFVPPKRPGPRPVSKYDQAFIRRTKGERLSKIMKDLEPEAYAADPYGTTQRYSAAIRSRKKRAARV